MEQQQNTISSTPQALGAQPPLIDHESNASNNSNTASISELLNGVRVQDSAEDAAAVMGALGSMMSRAALARWRGDERRLTIVYFVTVFCIRLFLRSTAAEALPACVVMCIEDGLSLLSFAIGLLYLHHSDGISRALFRKRTGTDAVTPGTEAVTPTPTPPPVAPQADAPRPPARPEDVKLFIFAM